MNRSKIIFITKKSGGFANRLWQYSYFLAYSKEHNIFIINPTFDEYREYFIGTKNNLSLSTLFNVFSIHNDFLLNFILFLRTFSKWGKRRFSFFNKNILIKSIKSTDPVNMDHKSWGRKINNKNIIFVDGWRIRCNISLNKHKQYIKSYFQPLESHRKNIINLLQPIKSDFEIVIGLHMRRADYESVYPDLYFTFQQYSEFMDRIKNYFKKQKVAFLLCSDEKIEKKYFSKRICFYSTGHFIEDMYALSQCNYIFGVSSTYSLWASFVGNVPIYLINESNLIINKDNFWICDGLSLEGE